MQAAGLRRSKMLQSTGDIRENKLQIEGENRNSGRERGRHGKDERERRKRYRSSGS